MSPFVAITASNCDNCSDEGGGVFDPSSSSTFVQITDPKDMKQMQVGNLTLNGYWGTDMIEIHTSDGSYAWVPQYQFFLVTHIDGSDDNNFSGVIGFGVPQTP